jgi:predicted HicB family RNase H-like nuclease
MMEYKGYKANIEYEEGDEFLYGRVIGLRDVITFRGKSIDELQKDFQESVDEYFNYCKENGKTPEKPFSGTFTIRIEPNEIS